ncbi:MAG: DUF4384 domain-containing protein [Spirochaetales bacterium]|nr:DUF4384 domain-containing protein [Spirochaetales bacterium]
MKQSFFAVSIILLPLILLSFATKPSAALSFKWALVSLDRDGGVWTVDCTPPEVTMNPGDLIKIYIEPIERAFVSLYLLDTENSLHLLFPPEPAFFDDGYEQGKRYTVPEGTEWFSLDEPEGVEYFYLVASAQRLHDLERLTAAYVSLREKTGNDRGEKIQAAQEEILARIRSIGKESSPLAEKEETPVGISGSFRGIEEVAGDRGVLVQSNDIYVRTIRIRH